MTEETRLEIEADSDAVARHLLEQGWTDGLPVVPPTVDRVAEMLATVAGSPGLSVGHVPLGWGDATLERLAANAVMAGCRPQFFPVVVAAVRALLAPEFNLFGIQATTHPVAPLLVVGGPIAAELGIQGGAGALGPGFTANATIGRAIRLILMNVGRAYPGRGDRSTLGSGAKFAFCLAENAAESPWPELHVERGFAAGDDAVSVFAVEGPHNVNDHESIEGRRLLDVVADVTRTVGHNSWYMAHHGRSDFVVMLCPEHARLLAAEGWSRADVQHYLFVRASRTVADLRQGGMWVLRDWPRWMNALAERDDALIPPVRQAEDITVLVAGGAGKHSVVLPGFGISKGTTVPVTT